MESQNPQQIQSLALQALKDYREDLATRKSRKTKSKKVRNVSFQVPSGMNFFLFQVSLNFCISLLRKCKVRRPINVL